MSAATFQRLDIRALNEAPISSAKGKLLTERIYAVCDEKDGLKDGSIENPLKCDFAPSRDLPQCTVTQMGVTASPQSRWRLSKKFTLIFQARAK